MVIITDDQWHRASSPKVQNGQKDNHAVKQEEKKKKTKLE